MKTQSIARLTATVLAIMFVAGCGSSTEPFRLSPDSLVGTYHVAIATDGPGTYTTCPMMDVFVSEDGVTAWRFTQCDGAPYHDGRTHALGSIWSDTLGLNDLEPFHNDPILVYRFYSFRRWGGKLLSDWIGFCPAGSDPEECYTGTATWTQ